MSKSEQSKAGKIVADGQRHELPLKALHLDFQNPRFGDEEFNSREEAKMVDDIISQHGIQDVISSLASNGFFDSEPLVGAINKGYGPNVTIIEGNRRLTACLVLAGDPRARKHERLRERYPNSQITSGTKLPVQVYDWENEKHRSRLIPYLGIRHIVGALQWDSYAKAAWVAQALENSELSLDKIKEMIGDDQDFTDRIVEGYYFVNQLRDSNSYDPENSLRKGRGSLQYFPFSWVYTVLGYRSVREFVGLPKHSQISKSPIDEDHLKSAANLMRFMFGGEGQNAAIDDSRQLGTLAKALSSEPAVKTLMRGGSISDATDAMKPPEELLLDLVARADKAIGDGINIASGIKEFEHDFWSKLALQVETLGTRFDHLTDIIEELKPSLRRKGGSKK